MWTAREIECIQYLSQVAASARDAKQLVPESLPPLSDPSLSPRAPELPKPTHYAPATAAESDEIPYVAGGTGPRGPGNVNILESPAQAALKQQRFDVTQFHKYQLQNIPPASQSDSISGFTDMQATQKLNNLRASYSQPQTANAFASNSFHETNTIGLTPGNELSVFFESDSNSGTCLQYKPSGRLPPRLTTKSCATSDASTSNQCIESQLPLESTRSQLYHCTYDGCTKGFRTQWHLLSHFNSHTKTRNHQCTHCPLSFTRKHDLTRHERSVTCPKHAVQAGIPVFRCDTCGKGYGRMDSLKRHVDGCSK